MAVGQRIGRLTSDSKLRWAQNYLISGPKGPEQVEPIRPIPPSTSTGPRVRGSRRRVFLPSKRFSRLTSNRSSFLCQQPQKSVASLQSSRLGRTSHSCQPIFSLALGIQTFHWQEQCLLHESHTDNPRTLHKILGDDLVNIYNFHVQMNYKKETPHRPHTMIGKKWTKISMQS